MKTGVRIFASMEHGDVSGKVIRCSRNITLIENPLDAPMPELPEVQTVVDILNRKNLPGRPITGAAVYWPKTVAPMTPDDFCDTIRGHIIRRITRAGQIYCFSSVPGADAAGPSANDRAVELGARRAPAQPA